MRFWTITKKNLGVLLTKYRIEYLISGQGVKGSVVEGWSPVPVTDVLLKISRLLKMYSPAIFGSTSPQTRLFLIN